MNKLVRPKKHLGQHFLRDANIARQVANSLTGHGGYSQILEVGPGTGALTHWLLQNGDYQYTGMEVDADSMSYLLKRYGGDKGRFLQQDILACNVAELMHQKPFAIIGNFPYNISSQILFKALELRDRVPELVGMFQKEVAERIASKPGNKVYGILSVLTQAFFQVEILFYVGEHVFDPPPKVQSAVIRLTRKEVYRLDCHEGLFFSVVKTAFNQRRKTLRNALKSMQINWDQLPAALPTLRAERLGVQDFVAITKTLKPPEVRR